MAKKDFLFATITGLIAGFLAWRVFDFLKIVHWRNLSFAWLIILVPILWLAGVWLGYFLGRRFNFFKQFGKYAAIGFTNAAVDFAVLNLLIAKTGIALGYWFSIFKGAAFLAAVTHSFFWNKYWAFEAGQSAGGSKEFGRFVLVNLGALALNVAVASGVANGLNPLFGLSDNIWANIGAVAGSAAALLISFVGFRLLVFKKHDSLPQIPSPKIF